jgi:hypothetical protein
LTLPFKSRSGKFQRGKQRDGDSGLWVSCFSGHVDGVSKPNERKNDPTPRHGREYAMDAIRGKSGRGKIVNVEVPADEDDPQYHGHDQLEPGDGAVRPHQCARTESVDDDEENQKAHRNLRLLGDPNFAACSLLIGITGVMFLGFMVLSPGLYVDQFGWEIVTAGYVIGLSAMALIIASVIASPYRTLVGVRPAVIRGSVLTATGWYLFNGVNLDASPAEVIVPGAFICFGRMVSFPVIAAQAFSAVPPRLRDEAAGLFNLLKTIGFSFGVTFISILIYRGTQANWSRMTGFPDPTRPGYSFFLREMGLTTALPKPAPCSFRLWKRRAVYLPITTQWR